MGRCACGGEKGKGRGHEWDGRVSLAPWAAFLVCFFKLKIKGRRSGCLQSRLIIAERRDTDTPCMYFHTCADGCVRTLRLVQRSWKVCGSASASSEAATGGQRRVGGGGGDARGEV